MFCLPQERHFAKDCPNQKKALINHLAQVGEEVDVSDLETLFSLDDDPAEDTMFTVGVGSSDSSEPKK